MDLVSPFPAGVRGLVHALTLDGPRETSLEPDAPAVPASTIEVLVALEAERAFADARLDPRERVRASDANRTTGPVGLSLQQDDLETSLRDLLAASAWRSPYSPPPRAATRTRGRSTTRSGEPPRRRCTRS